MPKASQTKRIGMLLYEDCQGLDAIGPLEVFAIANRQMREDQGLQSAGAQSAAYQLTTLAPSGTPAEGVRLSSGLRIGIDQTTDRPLALDTLLISGGTDSAVRTAMADQDLMAWLATASSRVRRIGSVCTGALLLAQAGVLNGRQATTHWMDAEYLQRQFPQVDVVPDSIYVHDDKVWTSAGITAGMDLALAMLAEDFGMPLALKVAKRMVMVSKLSGGQTQFSDQLRSQSKPDGFARLTDWVQGRLHQDIRIEDLAEQVHMSRRNFSRRFLAVYGVTPHRFIERMRVERAKAELENTTQSLQRIADQCGFGSSDTMRRAFLRVLKVTPSMYRDKFGPGG